MYFSNAATISAFPAPALRSVSSLRRPHREKDGSAIPILAVLGQSDAAWPRLRRSGRAAPGKGLVGRQVRHGGGARPHRLPGEERSWPVPAPSARLLASLDGDPGGREDQGRCDGDQRFQPCEPHHLDHSFGKSGDRHRHGAGRGRTRHEPGRILDERRGHRGRSFAGHLGPEHRGGRSEPAPTRRSRSRCRPRNRRLSTVPTGQPSRRRLLVRQALQVAEYDRRALALGEAADLSSRIASRSARPGSGAGPATASTPPVSRLRCREVARAVRRRGG